MKGNEAMRTIPKVDVVLGEPVLQGLACRPELIKREVVAELERVRSALREGKLTKAPAAGEVARTVELSLKELLDGGLRPLINATGVIVHTNLGRAPLGKQAQEALVTATSYADLEYDLERGMRGSRQNHIRPVTRACFGAEDALVVNNNAAAVLLVLAALANGREVIVSRGELVEIGGSFRIPDVMALSGAVLKEVGTTNKTRLSDYEKAITERTALIMKVHRSNFAVVGFSEETELRELSGLAHARGIPLYCDMGSGVPFALDAYGIRDEWTIPDCLSVADVISFSGDKVLGGPQAGIILGARKYLQNMAAHPLHRAVRLDKLGIAALSATLRLFMRGEYAEIPTLRMITEPVARVRARARRLANMLIIPVEVVATEAVIGGGSAPTKSFASFGVQVRVTAASEVHARLRRAGVVCRIEDDRLVCDMRTVSPEQVKPLASILNEVIGRGA